MIRKVAGIGHNEIDMCNITTDQIVIAKIRYSHESTHFWYKLQKLPLTEGFVWFSLDDGHTYAGTYRSIQDAFKNTLAEEIECYVLDNILELTELVRE